jgi:hypothetical protein
MLLRRSIAAAACARDCAGLVRRKTVFARAACALREQLRRSTALD